MFGTGKVFLAVLILCLVATVSISAWGSALFYACLVVVQCCTIELRQRRG